VPSFITFVRKRRIQRVKKCVTNYIVFLKETGYPFLNNDVTHPRMELHMTKFRFEMFSMKVADEVASLQF